MIEADDSIMMPKPSLEDIKPEFSYLENVIAQLRLAYMWPNATKTNSFRYNLMVWIVIIILTAFLLSCLLHALINHKDFDSIALPFSLSMDISSTIFHYIFVYVRGEKYIKIVSTIHNNFIHYSLFPSQNRTSIMRYYKQGHKVFKLYQILLTLYILLFCVAPILIYYVEVLIFPPDLNETSSENTSFPIVISVYVPFDYKKQPASFLFYVYQSLSFSLIAWLYLHYDAFICMVLFLTIGQFDLIKESFHTISETFKEKGSTEELKRLKENEIHSMEDALKHCIRQHQFIREFVRLLNEIVSPNMLVDTILAVLSTSCILLDASIAINIGDWDRFVNALLNSLTMMIHMFLYNYLGNEITVKDGELVQAVYDMPWHRLPKQKQLFVFTMAQARRPCRLTGGKLYTLSLEFFTTMMHGTFSYFAFLLKFRDDAPPPK